MADPNVRSDAVDVEQVMRQIRARIREKRGADYTEAELQQLATVKLEKFLDPRGLRSDLVEEFRRQNAPAPVPPNYEFGEDTLYETHRGFLRSLRNLLKPILKFFFNPDKITAALHIQSALNVQAEQRLRAQEQRTVLYYELVHNLTIEVTRLGIEVHNLKMRVESLSSRLDFTERRGRSLEGAVQYREAPRPGGATPSGQPRADRPETPARTAAEAEPEGSRSEVVPAAGPAGQGERRRRRRRRRRRPGQTAAESQAPWNAAATGGSGGQEGDLQGGDDDSGEPDDGPGGGEDSDGTDAPEQ